MLGAWVGGAAGFILAAVLAAGRLEDCLALIDARLDGPADAERGRRLASERDDLIAAGVDPGDLAVPVAPGQLVSWRRDDSPEVCVAGMGPLCGCKACVFEREHGQSW